MSALILQRWTSRLENWALYVTSGNMQHSPGVSSIYRSNGYRFDFTPRNPAPLIGDASDVDALIVQLSDAHRDALKATFIWTGTVADRAATLRIHPNTLRDRTIAACYRLEDLDKARRRASERVRSSACVAQIDAGATSPKRGVST